MFEKNHIDNINASSSLENNTCRAASEKNYFVGRSTCKRVEKKPNNKLEHEKQKKLEDIFSAIDEFLNALEKEKLGNKIEKYDYVFKLMSTLRRDLLTHKQLSSELNKIAMQEPKIAKAISDIKEKVYLLDEHIDLSQHIEHALYMKRK